MRYCYRIYTVKDGVEDYIQIESDSLDEIKTQAEEYVVRVAADEFWSEEYL